MTQRRLSLRLIVATLLAFALLVTLPCLARADDKDYSLDSTDIWARVHTDGTVSVFEERTVDLEGEFHGFFWDLSTNDGELGPVSIEVTGAGEIDKNDALAPYHAATSGNAEYTWTVEQSSSSTRVDVHYSKSDELARFYVTYDIDGIVASWQDTAELYWKFVGDQWEKASGNVSC